MHKRMLYLVPQQYDQAFFGQVRASRSAGDAAASAAARLNHIGPMLGVCRGHSTPENYVFSRLQHVPSI